MSNYKRMSLQVGFFYFSMIVSILIKPILLVILTRALSTEQWGVFSVFDATKSFLSILLELGIATYIVTKFSGETKQRKEKAFKTMTIFFMYFLVITFMIFSILHMPFLNTLGLGSYNTEFIILLAIIVISSFIRVITTFVVVDKRMELKAVLNFFNHTLWIFLLGLFVLFTNQVSFIMVMLIWLAGTGINLIIRFLSLAKYFKDSFKHKFDKSILRDGLKFGVPLIFFSLSSYILTIGDRYILTIFKGTSEVGFYSLAYSMVMLIFTASSTIPTVLYPYISEAWTREKKKSDMLFNISLKYGLIILIPAMFGTIILREPLITMVSGPRYLVSAGVVPYLIAFPLINFIIHLFTQNITLQQKTKRIAILYLLAGLFNVILNILFIPAYGMYAAAVTTIVSYLLLFMLLLGSSRITWNWKYIGILKMIAASILMSLIIYFIPAKTFIMKIITIGMGGLSYFAILLLLNPFIREEWNVFKKILKLKD